MIEDDEDYEEEMMGGERAPVIPQNDRKLRACLVSGLIKTEEQAETPRHPF